MEDKMAAGAFGRAGNDGWDGPNPPLGRKFGSTLLKIQSPSKLMLSASLILNIALQSRQTRRVSETNY